MQETQVRFLDQEETPWRRKWLSTWVFLEKYWEMPGKSHGQRSLAGHSPWGRRVRHGWATNTLLTVIAYCLLVVGGGTVRRWSMALQEGGLSGQQGGGQEYSHHIFQRPEGRNINSRTKLTQRLRKWPKQGVASELSRRQKWAKVPGKRGTLGKTLGQTKEGSSEWREIRGESHVLHTSYLLLAEIVLHARQSYSTLYVTSLRVMRGCKILVLNLGKRQLTESGAHLPAAADEPLERAKRDLSHDKESSPCPLCPAGSSNIQMETTEDSRSLLCIHQIGLLVGLVLSFTLPPPSVIIPNLCWYHYTRVFTGSPRWPLSPNSP